LAQDLALLQTAKEARAAGTRRVVVLQPDRHRDDHVLAHSASKHSMSWMRPSRSARQRARTRIPVFMFASEPASTACSIVVSAPSSLISAHANGFCNGLFLRGSFTQAHVVTTPESPTSTNSLSSSAVWGSYSTGGTMTWPRAPLIPWIFPSRNPLKKRPITGPTLRVYAYSRTWGARRTSSVAIRFRTPRRRRTILVVIWPHMRNQIDTRML